MVLDGLMILDVIYFNNNASDSICFVTSYVDVDSVKWHSRLGHIGQEGDLLVNLPICDHCPTRKAIRKSFRKP